MATPTIPVSIHPYFKLQPGQRDAVKPLLQEFLARTSTEPGVLHYEFTISGDTVFCREAYRDAAALLAHVANVGAQVQQMLAISTLVRVEIHGPAAELDQLRGPLAGLNPEWYVYECGLPR